MVCKVIINNSACTVIDYDGEQIQIAPIGKIAETVEAELKDGICTIIDGTTKATKTRKKNETAE